MSWWYLAPGAAEPTIPLGAPARFVRDAQEGEGPLAGAAAGSRAVRADLAIVAGGDMPDLSTAVVLQMLEVACRRGRCRGAAGRRPVPAAAERGATWPPRREAAHALLHRGERSLRSPAAQALRTAVIDEADVDRAGSREATLRDVDVPDDIDRSSATEPRRGVGFGDGAASRWPRARSRSGSSARGARRSISPTSVRGTPSTGRPNARRHPWAFLDDRLVAVARARVRRPRLRGSSRWSTRGREPSARSGPWAEAGDHTAEHALAARRRRPERGRPRGADPSACRPCRRDWRRRRHLGSRTRDTACTRPTSQHFLADPDPDGYRGRATTCERRA